VKYLLFFIFFSLLISCNKQVLNNNDIGLEIDIYKKNMSYDEFKKAVIEYADKASYPSLKN